MDATSLLVTARDARLAEERAAREVFVAAAGYAIAHADGVVRPDDYDPEHAASGGVGSVSIDPSAAAEFACALRLSTPAGRSFLADAVEVSCRLPRLWQRVCDDEVVVWRARKIAERTAVLSAEGAAWVDRRVAGDAHALSAAQIARTVEAARAMFEPDLAEEIRISRAETRHVTLHHQQDDIGGTVDLTATLDLQDALDVDVALAGVAAELAAAGDDDPLEVRRSRALGELARRYLHGHGTPGAESAPTPRRDLTLYLHLSDAALASGYGIGHCENTRSPITAGQIREWVAAPGARVTVRPVLDGDAPHHIDGYVPSPLLRDQVILRDATCVFPWCARSARGTDLDHIVPWAPGDTDGETSDDNLACLCRFHHRLKTLFGWTYHPLVDEHGTRIYHWTSPTGESYERGPTGTERVLPALLREDPRPITMDR
ncbi:HNH endonuclease [Nocardioides sp.]|uniref:HNH endonuclease signature motif containing protein n=1 Tax=Nocardioides sp. TaxID=35761 RepID=UPI003516504E